MEFFRWLVNLAAGVTIALTSLLFCIATCILYFRFTGRLTDGAMFFSMQTPSYRGLAAFLASSLLIVAACLLVRATFGQKHDFDFLRKSK